ncbi:MAG: carbohydrate kinase family protein [Inquilinaceae bacterium]
MSKAPKPPPPGPIACIGAANLDRKARAVGPVVLGSSNPVSVTLAPGGVARNVAETLTRLGCAVRMVAGVGRDADGDRLLVGLRALGIDTEGVARVDGRTTATYTALVDRDGEMVVALADMDIHDALTPDAIDTDHLGDCAFWFLDTNLPADTLRHLLQARPAGVQVAVDCVSVAKAVRLDGLLDRIDLLFANADEATALTGLPVRAPLEVLSVAETLRDAGVGAAVIGRGQDGVAVAADGVHEFLPAAPATVTEVTGAGDALAAGTLFGLVTGLAMMPSVRLGLATAAFAVEVMESVNPALHPDAVLARAKVAVDGP